jgi:hypothetical protein
VIQRYHGLQFFVVVVVIVSAIEHYTDDAVEAVLLFVAAH